MKPSTFTITATPDSRETAKRLFAKIKKASKGKVKVVLKFVDKLPRAR